MAEPIDPFISDDLQRTIDNKVPYRKWLPEYRALARAEADHNGAAEIRAQSLLGAGLAGACLLLDNTNGLLAQSLVMRIVITLPCFLLSAFLAVRLSGRWRGIPLIFANAVFAGSSAYLGNFAEPRIADRYVMGASLAISIISLISPLRSGAVLFSTGLSCAAILLGFLSHHSLDQPGTADMVVFVGLSCFSLMPLALRMTALKDRNFLLSLRVRLAQARLLDANDALRRLADSDPLTGLANRRKFEQLFDEAFDAALACGEPVAVMMIDIDHFKHFNDSHGHPAGDRCIREVAATIAHEADREGAIIARYGGEEFVTVLRGANAAMALSLSEKIRQRVAGLPIEVGPGSHQKVTLSIGLMIAKPAAFARNELVRLADQALYAAKQGGRNQVVLQSSASAAKQAGHTRRVSDRKVA